MSIFLYEMNIESIKIASENHIWNLVKLDNSWYHLDLTWDDPVTSNKSNVLEHKFFLIDSKQLAKFATGQHVFDLTIYKEFN